MRSPKASPTDSPSRERRRRSSCSDERSDMVQSLQSVWADCSTSLRHYTEITLMVVAQRPAHQLPRAHYRSLPKTNDLAREAVGCMGMFGGSRVCRLHLRSLGAAFVVLVRIIGPKCGIF